MMSTEIAHAAGLLREALPPALRPTDWQEHCRTILWALDKAPVSENDFGTRRRVEDAARVITHALHHAPRRWVFRNPAPNRYVIGPAGDDDRLIELHSRTKAAELAWLVFAAPGVDVSLIGSSGASARGLLRVEAPRWLEDRAGASLLAAVVRRCGINGGRLAPCARHGDPEVIAW